MTEDKSDSAPGYEQAKRDLRQIVSDAIVDLERRRDQAYRKDFCNLDFDEISRLDGAILALAKVGSAIKALKVSGEEAA